MIHHENRTFYIEEDFTRETLKCDLTPCAVV